MTARDNTARLEWREGHRRVEQAKKDRDVAYLIAALDSPDHRLRNAAILALRKLEARQAAPRLRELAAHDEDGNVQVWAASVLADWGDSDAFDLTVPLLEHPKVFVRGHAAFVLGRLADSRALAPLEKNQPKLYRRSAEWWVYGPAWRTAIAESRRAAAGKKPRPWLYADWFRRLRTALLLLALVVAVALLWVYTTFWWALALLACAFVWWLPAFWLAWKEPVD